MSQIPFFGRAVHAVLPYLKDCDRDYNPVDFPDLLGTYLLADLRLHRPTYGPSPTRENLKILTHPEWLARTREAWDLIAAKVQTANKVLFEFPMRHGRNPDLILISNSIEVTEIKTISPYVEPTPEWEARLNAQVVRSADILFDLAERKHLVEGFSWEFTCDDNLPMTHQYRRLCRREPEPEKLPTFLGQEFL